MQTQILHLCIKNIPQKVELQITDKVKTLSRLLLKFRTWRWVPQSIPCNVVSGYCLLSCLCTSTTKNNNHLHSLDFDIWVNLGGISSFGCAAWILASLQLIHVHTALSVWFLVFASSALSAIYCKFAIVSGLAKRDDAFEVLFSLPSSLIFAVCWAASCQNP